MLTHDCDPKHWDPERQMCMNPKCGLTKMEIVNGARSKFGTLFRIRVFNTYKGERPREKSVEAFRFESS